MDGKIEPQDYKEMSKSVDQMLIKLAKQKTDIEMVNKSFLDYLKFDISLIKNIVGVYRKHPL